MIDEALPVVGKTTLDQRRASDPRVSAWVSANAGAGKTKVLTDRVLRLLLAGSPPGRILCLTFTKAAAALVKVRHRMRPGGEPASSSRSTRSVSTLVLPAPAFADTQAETRGSAARRWSSVVFVRTGSASSIMACPRRRSPPTIP